MADQKLLERPTEEQIIAPGYSFASVTDQIAAVVLTKHTPVFWFATFSAAMGLLLLFMLAVGQLFLFGTGVWGLRAPTFWAWDITNFVWWIGIGHAGTLISAILLLFRQRYRTGINRAAEAMTIFAVICAGMFPIFHMGRVWDAPFIFPIPNTRGPVWVNFNSALLWDVFAIS